MLAFHPEGFKTIKCIKINKIGAAKAGDNREPSSIWCQPNGEEKSHGKDQQSFYVNWLILDGGAGSQRYNTGYNI